MSRHVGTSVYGIRGPIVKTGDNLSQIVTQSVLEAEKSHEITIKDKDVIAITESIVARAQGNYCTIDDIAYDVKRKFEGEHIGLIFPILSRNRFSVLLRGIARGCKKLTIMLSYPSDEVGNELFDRMELLDKDVNPYSDVLTLGQFRALFGYPVHPFTGMDYVQYYQDICKEEGCEPEIIFGNQAQSILNYTDEVITADIHTRAFNKVILKRFGAKTVLGLDDIMTESIKGSGYNSKYGLLGSNLSTGEKVKLFPRDAQGLVETVQKNILEATGKHVEVMVYGDGAFKDPQGKIWELADPVVSPFHTEGLKGTPNELKLKYLADNEFANLKGEELQKAIKDKIAHKAKDLKGTMATQGTTPRQITDLLGSLCDLTSGSGDKGTPFILVQGYFDNLTNE